MVIPNVQKPSPEPEVPPVEDEPDELPLEQLIATAEEAEKRLYADIRKIEHSNMKFPERKFYMTVVEFLYTSTSYYLKHETVSELLWGSGLDNKST